MQIDTGKLFEENISRIVPKENNNCQSNNNDIYDKRCRRRKKSRTVGGSD